MADSNNQLSEVMIDLKRRCQSAVLGTTTDDQREDLFADISAVVARLDASTEQNAATFYSGSKEGYRDAAIEHCLKTGSKMIDHTELGSFLNDCNLYAIDARRADGIWRQASDLYPAKAMGEITVFCPRNPSPTFMFCAQELPKLNANPNVTSMKCHHDLANPEAFVVQHKPFHFVTREDLQEKEQAALKTGQSLQQAQTQSHSASQKV